VNCPRPRPVFDPTLTSGGQVQFDIDAAAHNPAQNAEGVIRMLAYDYVRIGERTWTLRALDAPQTLSELGLAAGQCA
jgi:hypothetical protein